MSEPFNSIDLLRLYEAQQTLDPAGGPARQVACRKCGRILASANRREIFTARGPKRIEPQARVAIGCDCGATRVIFGG
jgi:hypothetical protein